MSDSPVIAFLNKMTDLILLNLLWLICCLPIITIGASTTAMYYVCIISIRQGDGYVIKRFFKSFTENFKQATLLWLVLMVLGAAMGLDLFFWYQMGTGFAKVMFCFSAIVAFVLLIVALYLFPLQAKLQGNMISIIKNAALFAVGYFPYTVILLLLNGLFLYANVTTLAMNAISIFIGFAVLAYVKSFFIYKILMKHIDERYDDFMS